MKKEPDIASIRARLVELDAERDVLNQAFSALSDNVIASHLRGTEAERSSGTEFVAGVYPVLVDETCWLLAADFDGNDWSADALAYMETCRLKSVPAALERSRSGEGGHVWIFFSQPIPARDARQLGAALLTETLDRRPEVGFASYDRMFPSQDTLPKGGFGNLIALPLQRRARDYGDSVFVDGNLLLNLGGSAINIHGRPPIATPFMGPI
jgi:hypothetical protein